MGVYRYEKQCERFLGMHVGHGGRAVIRKRGVGSSCIFMINVLMFHDIVMTLTTIIIIIVTTFITTTTILFGIFIGKSMQVEGVF